MPLFGWASLSSADGAVDKTELLQGGRRRLWNVSEGATAAAPVARPECYICR